MKIGFIGAGNMGGALIKGITGTDKNDHVFVYDKNPDRLKEYDGRPKTTTTSDLKDLIDQSDIIVLAVKPNIFESILPEIKGLLDTIPESDNKTFVSIAAGISINYMKTLLGENTKIIRTMPNLNAMVSQGMTGISRDSLINDDEFSAVMDIFDAVGKAAEVDEDMIDTVIGISGSSPAYAFMFINALMDCAEKNGMDRDTAKLFASQAVLGAAVTVMESGIDPKTLTNNVCSPGGTTIEAVNKLNELGFENIIEEAMTAAIEKSKKMTK